MFGQHSKKLPLWFQLNPLRRRDNARKKKFIHRKQAVSEIESSDY